MPRRRLRQTFYQSLPRLTPATVDALIRYARQIEPRRWTVQIVVTDRVRVLE